MLAISNTGLFNANPAAMKQQPQYKYNNMPVLKQPDKDTVSFKAISNNLQKLKIELDLKKAKGIISEKEDLLRNTIGRLEKRPCDYGIKAEVRDATIEAGFNPKDLELGIATD